MAAAPCDLNVLIDEEHPAETVKKVEQLIRFGYQVIALNTIHRISAKRARTGKKKGGVAEASCKITPEKIISMLKTKPDNFKILSRVTVILETHDHIRELQSEYIKSFDLVAVRPVNDKLFHQVCTQLDVADIISLDLDSRLTFKVKFRPLSAAIERGLFVEISYASSIRSSSLRQNVLFNGMGLVTRSRGRGFILSSGAENFMEIRGLCDVINLGLLFGLREQNSKEAITRNCRDAILHAYSRKHTAKSVISMRKVGEPLSTMETIIKNTQHNSSVIDDVFTQEPLIKRIKQD
eukprot:gene510-1157_t